MAFIVTTFPRQEYRLFSRIAVFAGRPYEYGVGLAEGSNHFGSHILHVIRKKAIDSSRRCIVFALIEDYFRVPRFRLLAVQRLTRECTEEQCV